MGSIHVDDQTIMHLKPFGLCLVMILECSTVIYFPDLIFEVQKLDAVVPSPRLPLCSVTVVCCVTRWIGAL